METIFDYDPTPEELRYLTGAASKETYLSGLTPDESFEDLAGLFAMRGDGERAGAYARQISDQEYVRLNILNQDFRSDSAERNTASRAVSSSKAA